MVLKTIHKLRHNLPFIPDTEAAVATRLAGGAVAGATVGALGGVAGAVVGGLTGAAVLGSAPYLILLLNRHHENGNYPHQTVEAPDNGKGGEMISDALESKYTWFHSPSGDRLHYIPEAADNYEFWERACWGSDVRSKSLAACGLKTDWIAPGIFSRMGMPRCKRCCDLAGIPYGDGTPFNTREEILEKRKNLRATKERTK